MEKESSQPKKSFFQLSKIPKGRSIEFHQFFSEVTHSTDFTFDVYLSGKMSGMPDFNYGTFNETARWLRHHGIRVFNPAENFNGDSFLKRSTYLRRDIAKLSECGAILMLDEWFESEGAKLEFVNALEFDMDMYYYNTRFKMLAKYEK